MAQTTNAIWGGASYVGISSDGTTWTDISGHANKVSPSGGDRQSGQAYTFDGEYPIVKVGKKNTRSTRVDIIYTEVNTDAFTLAKTQFDASGGGTLYVRWSPGAGDIGDLLFTTDAGFVQDFQYPEVDAEATGPIHTYFVVQHATVTQSTLATAV